MSTPSAITVTCSHDCLLCYDNVCLFMTWSQVKLRINLSFRNDRSSKMSQKMSLFSCILILVTDKTISQGGSWKSLFSWCTSNYVLLGFRLGAVVVIPLENQVNILIFQFCCHITFRMIYEWLNCAFSRPVYGPMHSWATNDWHFTRWLALVSRGWYLNLKGFLKCRLPCRIRH